MAFFSRKPKGRTIRIAVSDGTQNQDAQGNGIPQKPAQLPLKELLRLLFSQR